MHIIFTFPIVDSRHLLPDRGGKLYKPLWKDNKEKLVQKDTPNDEHYFIRHFGAVKPRKSGGSKECSEEFPHEDLYCDAHFAIEFDNLTKQGFCTEPNKQAGIYKSYRRFFSTDRFASRIEVGFVDNIESKIAVPNGDKINSEVNIEDILKHYANIPVKVDGEKTELYKAGGNLAKLYQERSTSKAYLKQSKYKENALKLQHYVESGERTIMLIYTANGALQLPEHVTLLDEFILTDNVTKHNYGVLKLYGYKLEFEKYYLKIWLIEKPPNFDSIPGKVKSTLRDLRINLTRIHEEKEAIRLLLRNIECKNILLEKDNEEATMSLYSYFKETIAKLYLKERYKLPQKNLLDFSLQSEEQINPNSFFLLQKQIDNFNKDYLPRWLKTFSESSSKKNILFICNNPSNVDAINCAKELNSIKDPLHDPAIQKNFDFEDEPNLRLDYFLSRLKQYKPYCLHLSMHRDNQGLFFEDENGNKCQMSVEVFENKLKEYCSENNIQKIPLIIISACISIAYAQAAKKYCEYSVGTVAKIPVEVGIWYAAGFYENLIKDNASDIAACHNAGKQRIKDWVETGKHTLDPIKIENNIIDFHEILVLI